MCILAAGFFYDSQILRLVANYRYELIDKLMLFMTNLGLTLISVALFGYIIARHRWKELTMLAITLAMSMGTSYLLKKIFQVPRPIAAEPLVTIILTQVAGYSFPSLHATYCFSVIPHARRIFRSKWLKYGLIILLLLVVYSRIYLGVHYLSDLAGGALIGFLFAKMWLYLEEKYDAIEWFMGHVKSKLELRRQIAHLLTGVFIVVLLKYHILNAELLLAVALIGGLISIISKKYQVPVIYPILRFFERPNEIHTFPGKGALFFVLGSLLSLLLFDPYIAMASIAIMAVGDAVTTIVGTYFGRVKNPLNPKKHLEGTVLAIMLSTIAAFYIVDFPRAFMGSIVGMLVESLTVQYVDRVLDDNLLIPLVAGAVMTWMG